MFKTSGILILWVEIYQLSPIDGGFWKAHFKFHCLINYHVIFDFGRPSSNVTSYMVVFSFCLSRQLISANGSVGGA